MRTIQASYFLTSVEDVSDKEIAQFLVRCSHPSTHYLRSDVRGLGFSIRMA